MSTARGGSIRRLLLIWLLTPLALVCVLVLVHAYFDARRIADRAYDRMLLASALTIAERVVVADDGELEVDLPYVALEMLGTSAQDRVFYRVSGPDGALVTGYRDLPPPQGTAAGGERYYDARYRGEWVRVALLERPLPGGGRFRVEVAQTRGERDRLIRELVLAAGLRVLLVVVLAALCVVFGIGQGLRPLARLERTIRARSPEELTPIDDPVPREVRHLVAAINQLLGRLEASLTAMRRFIADASHQLRTPLAGLQTQTELALAETDPAALRQALMRLHAVTRRTSRLANQLLSLARAAPEGGLHPQPLDLAALARERTRERVPAALARGLDLGYEGADSLPLHGDPLLLGELLANLIDNALRYCPAGSTITVRAARVGEQALLEVEDDGPGIPEAERERVLERFYRIPGGPAEGCGLGLAIVKAVAERHDAALELGAGQGGRGLRVRCRFPQAASGGEEAERDA
ncbi:MAG TPA: sensor histidine kinase N-terminal domain-containing protein [Candidatus Competibacteraceae bacterium]|nr:sensor histidine kinase N-terminal domain-containing protein [Candidatus Competibacteraceae bacterium]